jgi:hypothetical protein
LSEHESCCEEEYTCEAQQVTSPEAATNIFLHRPPSVAEIYERLKAVQLVEALSKTTRPIAVIVKTELEACSARPA